MKNYLVLLRNYPSPSSHNNTTTIPSLGINWLNYFWHPCAPGASYNNHVLLFRISFISQKVQKDYTGNDGLFLQRRGHRQTDRQTSWWYATRFHLKLNFSIWLIVQFMVPYRISRSWKSRLGVSFDDLYLLYMMVKLWEKKKNTIDLRLSTVLKETHAPIGQGWRSLRDFRYHLFLKAGCSLSRKLAYE